MWNSIVRHTDTCVFNFTTNCAMSVSYTHLIMEDPLFLILDEPFNGLDKHGVEEIRELLLD